MAELPQEVKDPIACAIYMHYQRVYGAEKPRGYLGASSIGGPCSRALWYGFRMAKKPSFDGRMYRLFQSGHLQEPRVIADLRAIGCTVYEVDSATGNQWSFSEPETGHHFRGNCDGIVVGVPGAPKAPHILEIKTSNAKDFADLQKNGVEKSKPIHYFQMQIYMRWTLDKFGKDGCKRALYISVNKNSDELYTERIEYNKDVAQSIVDKAKSIITASEPPQRISNDASWYQCKLCDYSDICHGTDLPQPNCRSCVHSTPEMDGDARWSCAKHKFDLLFGNQLVGCEAHRYLPSVINFAKPVDSDGDAISYDFCGRKFSNGPKPGFSSKEMYSCKDKKFLLEMTSEDFLKEVREKFGAEVVC